MSDQPDKLAAAYRKADIVQRMYRLRGTAVVFVIQMIDDKLIFRGGAFFFRLLRFRRFLLRLIFDRF